MIQIVYVQPGSIYLAIGAKTSSVWNIFVISLHYRKNSHTADFVFFDGGKSSRDSFPSAIIIRTACRELLFCVKTWRKAGRFYY